MYYVSGRGADEGEINIHYYYYLYFDDDDDDGEDY